MPHVARNKSPVPGSLDAGESVDPGATLVQDAFGGAVGVAIAVIRSCRWKEDEGPGRVCTLTFCRCDWLVPFAFAGRQALFADMIPNPAQEAHIIREAGSESAVPARTAEEGTFLDCLVGDATFSAEADAGARLMNGGSILASCGDNRACRSRCCSWDTCLLVVSLTMIFCQWAGVAYSCGRDIKRGER